MKIRIRFAKTGAMKFIGHLDTMRFFQKVMRRAEADICMSGGFSPHQIMSIALPLGVGTQSTGEYMDIEVHSTQSSARMVSRLNAASVEGFQVLSWRLLPDTAAAAMSAVAAADYEVRFREGYGPDDFAAFEDAFSAFLEQDEIVILKKTKKGMKEWDIRPCIYQVSFAGERLLLKTAAGSVANVKPDAVVRAFFESRGMELSPFALELYRTELYAAEGEGEDRVFRPLESFGSEILEEMRQEDQPDR